LQANSAHMAQFESVKLHHYNATALNKAFLQHLGAKGIYCLEIKIFYFQVCV